jgi:hypothetical protein
MSIAFADTGPVRRTWGWWPSLGGLARAFAERVDVQGPIVSPPTTAVEPPWLEEVGLRIADLSILGHDWDGRRSAAVNRDVLQFVFSVLQVTMAPTTITPAIVPLGHGGVQLDWKTHAHEIEVEVTKPYDLVIYHLDRASGREREWRAEADLSELANLLRSEFTR